MAFTSYTRAPLRSVIFTSALPGTPEMPTVPAKPGLTGLGNTPVQASLVSVMVASPRYDTRPASVAINSSPEVCYAVYGFAGQAAAGGGLVEVAPAVGFFVEHYNSAGNIIAYDYPFLAQVVYGQLFQKARPGKRKGIALPGAIGL